jgi:ligand-binding sensor domain-containing protein
MTMLTYRGGTYATFVQLMLDRLQSQHVEDSTTDAPLGGIHFSSTDDLVTGIVRAWASVADVLTFYQERIANEGFIRTATEPESIVELAHAIGYQPRQALAASVHLAFAIGSGPGIARELTVPIGTRVQSLPGPGERPQVFETIESLPMRAEWSDLMLEPVQPSAPPPIQTGATNIVLDGVNLRLKPGDLLDLLDEATYQPPVKHLIWGTELPLSVHGRWRTIATVQPLPAQQRTRVTWDDPLDGATLAEPAVFVYRKQARMFGFDAADWSGLPDDQKLRLSPAVGGMFHSEDRGDRWAAASGSTTNKGVRAFIFDGQGRVFAATAGDGVLRSVDGGGNWQQVNAGLIRKDVHALAADGQGALYAGTAGGSVMRSIDAGDTWTPLRTENNLQVGPQGLNVNTTRLPNTVVRALAVSGTNLLAGTDDGMFRAPLGGNGWQRVTSGLPQSTAITRLVAVSDNLVIAGANQGVFTSTNQGNSWSSAANGLPQSAPVLDLAVVGNQVFAATDRGLFVSTAQAQLRWSAAGAPDGTLRALASDGTTLYAGTTLGVTRSEDRAATWQSISTGLTGSEVTAIAAASTQVLAALAHGSAPGDQWPEFAVAPDVVDLDGTYAGVARGGWFLVTQPDVGTGIFPVLRTQRVLRNQFGKRGFVTSVTTNPDPQLPTFSRREAIVYIASEQIAMAVDPVSILSDAHVVLSTVLADPLVPGRAVALTGKRPHGRLAPTLAGHAQLLSDDGRTSVGLTPGELVEVLAAHQTQPGPGVVWRLRHHSGLEGSVTLQPAELNWAAADADSEQVSEIMWLAESVADDGSGHGHLTFTRAPANVYDSASVHLNANVVMATHGESVQEVLGSGDFTQTHQQFTLKKPPITRYLLPGQLEPTSTLKVWVNKVLWQPTDALVDVAGTSREYALRTDEDGSVQVLFGDGTAGARLPTGNENVVATYRTGAGPNGEVRANSLVQLLNRPLGVRGVTNPLRASGAAEAEPSDSIRTRAPRSLSRRHRIVSLDDYALFASGFADVAKANVRVLHLRDRPLIHVTVAPAPAANLSLDALADAIRAAQPWPRPFRVDLCNIVHFRVSARIVADPTVLVADPAEDVRAAVVDAFSLERRELAQPVPAAEIIRVIQSVLGVHAVDLIALHYSDAQQPALESALVARATHVDPETGQIFPSELLLVESEHLLVEVA